MKKKNLTHLLGYSRQFGKVYEYHCSFLARKKLHSANYIFPFLSVTRLPEEFFNAAIFRVDFDTASDSVDELPP